MRKYFLLTLLCVFLLIPVFSSAGSPIAPLRESGQKKSYTRTPSKPGKQNMYFKVSDDGELKKPSRYDQHPISREPPTVQLLR